MVVATSGCGHFGGGAAFDSPAENALAAGLLECGQMSSRHVISLRFLSLQQPDSGCWLGLPGPGVVVTCCSDGGCLGFFFFFFFFFCPDSPGCTS